MISSPLPLPHRSKSYHLGFGKSVTRSNLAKANQNRDYKIFEEFAYYIVGIARSKRVDHIFKLDGNVYAFDSTTIKLCLDVFWWAKFCKRKGGIKVHTLYDIETQIPTFFHITTASTHDSKVMDEILEYLTLPAQKVGTKKTLSLLIMGVKHYDQQFKERAVKLSYQRTSVRQAARELGISDSQLSKWRKDYAEYGENSFP